MDVVILSVGFVLIFEGLVFALAPSRLEDMLEALRLMPVEARRLIGLLAIVAGGAFVALAAGISA